MNFRIAQFLLFLGVAWLLASSGLWDREPLLLLPCALVAVLSCLPTFKWIRGGAPYIPLGEAYCLLHLVYYLVPLLDEREAVFAFSPDVRWNAMLAVCLFLGLFQVTYHFTIRSVRSPRRMLAALMQGGFPEQRETILIWALFGVSLLFRLLLSGGFLPDVGGVFNALRTVFTAGGIFAVFCLSHRLGRGTLAPGERLLFPAGMIVYLAIEFTTGFLVGGATMLLTAFLAYTMGRKRPPIVLGLCTALLLAFLHAGKGEFRGEYWENVGPNQAGRDPLEAYTYWFNASWNASFAGESEESGMTKVIERGSLLQMLGLAIDDTPSKLPYLHGLTYRQLITLLIPRVFWPAKPRGTLPTETLSLYYGIQTAEAVDSTSIGWGQIAEAWSNFGWIGVVIAGAFIGMMFGIGAGVSAYANPNQPGFIMAALMVPLAVDLEHSLAQMITILVQTLAVGGLLIFLLRIAAEDGNRPKSPRELFQGTEEGGSAAPR